MRLTVTVMRGVGAGALAVALAFSGPVRVLACTQVYVGSGVTATGDTYVGRTEDFAPRHAKAFGIQEPRVNPTYTSMESDFTRTFTGTTYRYTYMRDLSSEWGGHASAYSEAGTNERGVSVSATVSTDCNEAIARVDPLCDERNPRGNHAGVGEFNIADIVLGEADTARHGCEILGGIIDRYGAHECNQLIIADSAETWLFQMLSGHQWLALKMGRHEASVNPNMGSLQFKVDVDDKTSCLHSEGLVSVPRAAGLLRTFDDGTPNIAETYGEVDSGANQYVRYAQGRAYFGAPLTEGADYARDDRGRIVALKSLQLTFTPGKKVGTIAALRALATRGEHTDTLNANLDSGLYAVGNNRTTESHIFQIRDGLTPDIATVQWEALSRAEFSLFLPSYSAVLTSIDREYYPLADAFESEHQGDQYTDSVDAALREEPGRVLDYVMMDINTLAYNNRAACAPGVRAYLDALQRSIVAQQERVDRAMIVAPATARTEMANALFAQVTTEAYAKCKALLDELRAYVRAGDTSTPFVPSDYDAAADAPRVPLLYAASVVAPAITSQPASVQCEQGERVDFSVVAAADDGAQGTDALLTYEWQRFDAATGTFHAIDGETGPTLSLEALVPGGATYRVRVSNATGVSVISDEATLMVDGRVAPPVLDGDSAEEPLDGADGDAGGEEESAAGHVTEDADTAATEDGDGAATEDADGAVAEMPGSPAIEDADDEPSVDEAPPANDAPSVDATDHEPLTEGHEGALGTSNSASAPAAEADDEMPVVAGRADGASSAGEIPASPSSPVEGSHQEPVQPSANGAAHPTPQDPVAPQTAPQDPADEGADAEAQAGAAPAAQDETVVPVSNDQLAAAAPARPSGDAIAQTGDAASAWSVGLGLTGVFAAAAALIARYRKEAATPR